jgi:hypothetical protein
LILKPFEHMRPSPLAQNATSHAVRATRISKGRVIGEMRNIATSRLRSGL